MFHSYFLKPQITLWVYADQLKHENTKVDNYQLHFITKWQKVIDNSYLLLVKELKRKVNSGRIWLIYLAYFQVPLTAARKEQK